MFLIINLCQAKKLTIVADALQEKIHINIVFVEFSSLKKTCYQTYKSMTVFFVCFLMSVLENSLLLMG